MKKIALFIVAAASLAACTKWENKSTEFKVTGVWTGINTQINIQALPFIDSSDVQNTTAMEANFMEDGGLTIDSAGTRMDSLGWAIKNDTILVLKGLDLGIEIPGSGGVGASNVNFVIAGLQYSIIAFTNGMRMLNSNLLAGVAKIRNSIVFLLLRLTRLYLPTYLSLTAC